MRTSTTASFSMFRGVRKSSLLLLAVVSLLAGIAGAPGVSRVLAQEPAPTFTVDALIDDYDSWDAKLLWDPVGEKNLETRESLSRISPTFTDASLVVTPDGRTLKYDDRDTKAAVASLSGLSDGRSSIATLTLRPFTKSKKGKCGIGYNGSLTCAGPKAWTFGGKSYNGLEVVSITFQRGACRPSTMKANGWRVAFNVCRRPSASGTVSWTATSVGGNRTDKELSATLLGSKVRVVRENGLLASAESAVVFNASGELSFVVGSFSRWSDDPERVTVEILFAHPSSKSGQKWYQVARRVRL